jgi:hypothetical protein
VNWKWSGKWCVVLNFLEIRNRATAPLLIKPRDRHGSFGNPQTEKCCCTVLSDVKGNICIVQSNPEIFSLIVLHSAARPTSTRALICKQANR